MVCDAMKEKRKNPPCPSLQDPGNGLESESISVMTCPSLQDSLWQESSNNFLVLHKISHLTRPSLQDQAYGASCLVPAAGVDSILHIQDVGPYIFANNPGSPPSSTFGHLSGYPGSPDHSSFFDVAISFSSHSDILFCYNIDDS